MVMTFRSSNPDASCCPGADGVLAEVLEQLAARLQAGEPFCVAEFAAQWPEHEQEIHQLYPAIAAMVEMAGDLPGDVEGSQASLLDSGSIAAEPRRRLGDFQILREVGRGGMGVVYEAEQLSLGRRVALKVLPFAAMLDERLLKRFKNEARAAATLEHPHIVSVHFIGCERGIHFFAMQFVDGQTLEQVISRLSSEAAASAAVPDPGPKDDDASSSGSWLPGDPWESGNRKTGDSASTHTRARDCTASLGAGSSRYHQVAQLVAEAADALQHAHQQRVVHRDIKPSNLMLDEQGRLWITDFGLATTFEEANLTRTGDMVGTLRYSSPEQARGGSVVDHRTDVYSLGITLYELLALRPAFEARDRRELLRLILHENPLLLRRVRPDIPADLEVIVSKATAKEPQERYQTAGELADDLRRFLSHQLIKARPPTMWEGGIKWIRRRPGVALVMALSSVAVLAVAIALGIYTVQLRWAYTRLDELRQENLHRESELHRGIYYPANIAFAASAIDRRDFATARRSLESCIPAEEGIEDPRGFEWSLLENRAAVPPLAWTFASRGDTVVSVAVSPDSRFAATGDKAGTVCVLDLRSGERLQSFRPFVGETRVEFSPRGSWLIAGSDYQNGRVVLWNTADWTQAASFVAHDGTIYALAFTANEETLATGGREEIIKFWKTADVIAANGSAESVQPVSCQQIRPGSVIYELRFAPDASWLLSAEAHNRLRLWNTSDGSLRKTICESEARASLQGAVLLGQGKFCAAGGYADQLRFFDLESSRELASLDCRDGIFDVAISRDERSIAVACDDGSVTFWQISDPAVAQARRLTFGAHEGHVHRLAFSPDGRYLLTAGSDGTAKAWDLARLPAPDMQLINLRTGSGTDRVCYSPNGDWLAVHGCDGPIRILDAHNGALLHEIGEKGRSYDHVQFDAASQRFAASSDKEVFLWDTSDWSRAPAIATPGVAINSFCFAATGMDLVILSAENNESGCVSLWNSPSGTSASDLDLGRDLPTEVVRSPDGSLVAVAVDAARLLLVELPSLRMRQVPLPVSQATHLAFSNSGKRLAAVGNGDTFCLVDVAQGKLLSYHRIVAGEISGIAFTVDERLLAIADRDQHCVHLWDQASSRMLFSLDPLHFQPCDLSLSPDGRFLATCTQEADSQGNSGLILWDLLPATRR